MISKTIGFRGLAYFQTNPCVPLDFSWFIHWVFIISINIYIFVFLFCCIIRMYWFASWDGTVGGLCLKCVCVCVLAWTTPKAKWEPIGKQFGSAVFTSGFGVSKSEATLRKNSVIMMFSTCFFLRLTCECWEWVVIASENQGMCQVVCQDTTRTWQSHWFLVLHFLIQSDPSLSGGFPHFSLSSHRQFDPSPMVCACTVYRICTQRGEETSPAQNIVLLVIGQKWALPWFWCHGKRMYLQRNPKRWLRNEGGPPLAKLAFE